MLHSRNEDDVKNDNAMGWLRSIKKCVNASC